MLISSTLFISRLKFAHKFILAGVMFLAPFMVALYYFQSELDNKDNIAIKERAGIACSKPVFQLIHDIDSRRLRVVNDAVFPPPRKAASLTDADSAIENDVREIDTAQEKYGDYLSTSKNWESLKEKLAAVQAMRDNPTDITNAHTQLSAQLNSFLNSIAVNSNLAIDPEVDAYSITDTLFMQAPSAIASAAEARDIEAQIAGSGKSTKDQKNQLTLLSKEFSDSSGNIRSDIEEEAHYNSSLSGSLNSIAQPLVEKYDRFSDLLNKRATRLSNQAADLTKIDGQYAQVAAASDLYFKEAPKSLDNLLAVRSVNYQKKRLSIDFCALIFVGLTCCLFIGMHRSIRDIGKELAQTASRIRNSQISEEDDNLITEMKPLLNIRGDNELIENVNDLQDAIIETNTRFKLYFKNKADKITTLVSAVRETSEMIGSLSDSLRSEKAELIECASQQSADIEKTAANIEEVVGSITETTEYSQKAAEIAQDASKSASDGADTTNRAAESIQRALESSQQIARVIGCINDIAIQTNILALSATGEADMAGANGRGYSVLAADIWKLSVDCASSAQNISNIFQEISGRIKESNSLVDENGDHFSQISRKCEMVANNIAKISSALDKQSSDVKNANQSIAEVDAITHQKAQLINRSAYPSDKMNEIARRLEQLVNQFGPDSNSDYCDNSNNKSEESEFTPGYRIAPSKHRTSPKAPTIPQQAGPFLPPKEGVLE